MDKPVSKRDRSCGAIIQLRAKLAWSKLLGALGGGGTRTEHPLPDRDSVDPEHAIGHDYDRTRRPDPDLFQRLTTHLSLQAPARVLDLACGTGNYAALLARAGFQVTGVDRSYGMLAPAARKAPAVSYCRNDARDLAFKAGSFDGAVCISALHRFDDLEPVLRETHRVMASGRLVIFTALRQQMRGYWLNRYFPATLERAIAQMPDQNAIEAALNASGFTIEAIEPWEVPERPVDLFLYGGKHQPGLYLDRRVRAGISAFAELADPKETIKGMKKLAADIASGQIDRVMAEFHHDQGDYSFLVAAKDS